MKDTYGRPLENIRISVNEDCNLDCYYCHNEGQPHSDRGMTPEEIGRLLRVAAGLGVRGVKLTGGEPLCRSDLVEIVEVASGILEEVSLTTNGTMLGRLARPLKEAGLARVNVSLDTLDRERFRRITGHDSVDLVLEGIGAAVAAGLSPVKVNIVALADSGVDDLTGTARAVWAMGAMPQIIEMVADKGSEQYAMVEDYVITHAAGVRQRGMQNRRIYTVEDGEGSGRWDVELVGPVGNTNFCAACNRLRVTSGGMVKPCLMHNDGLVDVLTPMREGATDDELRDLFVTAVNNRVPYWR